MRNAGADWRVYPCILLLGKNGGARAAMSVTVEYYGALGERLGQRLVEMQVPEPCSLASLLDILCQNQPGLTAIFGATHSSASSVPLCAFVVNGRLVPANRADSTLLHDGDKVTLMLLPAGG